MIFLYDFSWLITDIVVNTVSVFFMITTGHLLSLDFFVDNAFGLYFFTLWLTALAFTAFAMLISALTAKTAFARMLIYAFFILTFLAAPIITVVVYALLTDEEYDDYRTGFGFLVSVQFYKAFGDLSTASSGETAEGFEWSDRTKNDDTWNLEACLHYLTYCTLVYGSFAWYLEQVLPSNYHGRAMVPWFFLRPTYWFGSSSDSVSETELGNLPSAIEIEGMTKRFLLMPRLKCENTSFCCCCCMTFERLKRFTAVSDLSMKVENNSLLALLGHNGAGKSTTFNILTGNFPPTRGDATIFGHSVKTGMDSIRAIMGVCPQHGKSAYHFVCERS